MACHGGVGLFARKVSGLARFSYAGRTGVEDLPWLPLVVLVIFLRRPKRFATERRVYSPVAAFFSGATGRYRYMRRSVPAFATE